MKNKLTLFALFLALATVAQNRSIEFFHGSFSELLAKAKKENKMIYVDCYTTWCGPCKWMAKNVFTNDTVADFYNKNFVNAKIDMENGEGIELAKQYGIQAYPTMLYLDGDGKQLHRTCGSSPAQAFISHGKDALSPNTQLATYAANFKKSADLNSATKYFSMLRDGCSSSPEEADAYLSSLSVEQLHSRAGWNLLYNFAEKKSSKAFSIFENDYDYYSKIYSADSVFEKIRLVYQNAMNEASQKKDRPAFEALCKELRDKKIERAEQIITAGEVRDAIVRQDWQSFSKHAAVMVEKYVGDDAYRLNSFAWNFYEHVDDPAMLGKAEHWAKRATELENNYAYNDTYAAILYKSGKKAEAKAAAEKAIELAKKEGENYTETAELLKKIEALK